MLTNLAEVQEINKSVFPVIILDDRPKIDQKTLDDYYAFFTGKEVDMLPYVYAEPSDAYSNLVHAPEYYLFRDEVNTIANNKDALKKHLKDITDIIEIGPGCDYTVENKTVPILNCAANLKRYHAVDYSENYLKEACNSVKKRKSDIDVLGVKADLMNGKINLNITPDRKRCVLFLGSTLGNFTEKQQHYAIDQIAGITNPGDIFVLSVDTNCDELTVLKSYNNASFYNFAMNALHNFINYYPSFKKFLSYFEVVCLWDNQNCSNNAYIKLKDNIIFNLINHGQINLSKNQMLNCIKSHKFDLCKINKILKNVFEINEIISYSGKSWTFICKRK